MQSCCLQGQVNIKSAPIFCFPFLLFLSEVDSDTPIPLLRILSANQYELAFVVHHTAQYWFELLRISSLPLSY